MFIKSFTNTEYHEVSVICERKHTLGWTGNGMKRGGK